jgi:hypothetical protein
VSDETTIFRLERRNRAREEDDGIFRWFPKRLQIMTHSLLGGYIDKMDFKRGGGGILEDRKIALPTVVPAECIV